VKFLLGGVSKICALHRRPLFRITGGMYLARDRRSVRLERERFAKLKDEGNNSARELEQRLTNVDGQNINMAVNGIAKLLQTVIEEDD
jgi:hypothetical protein